MSNASASAMASRRATTAGGKPRAASSSALKRGMSLRSAISTFMSFGASSAAVSSSARLWEPRRRDPAMPRTRLTAWVM